MRRTEQGKSLRKAYESKDNLLVESNRGGRRSSQLTSPSMNQEPLIEPTVSRQDMMQEFQILGKTVPVLLSCKGTKFEKFVEFCSTLMARDFKGFGNQAMTGVITVDLKDK